MRLLNFSFCLALALEALALLHYVVGELIVHLGLPLLDLVGLDPDCLWLRDVLAVFRGTELVVQ